MPVRVFSIIRCEANVKRLLSAKVHWPFSKHFTGARGHSVLSEDKHNKQQQHKAICSNTDTFLLLFATADTLREVKTRGRLLDPV